MPDDAGDSDSDREEIDEEETEETVREEQTVFAKRVDGYYESNSTIGLC